MTNITRLKRIIDDLKNPWSYKRCRAMDDLMSIRDPLVVPHLFRMVLKESDLVKVQFCRFLGHMKIDAAIPPLVTLLLDRSDMVAREAARALDTIESDRKSDALILVMKKRINQFSRLFAVSSLGRGKAVKAVPYLVELLSSGEEDIKEMTIESLRQIGDPAAIKALISAMEGQQEDLVYSILLALGEIGGRKTGAAIMPLLSHESEKVRIAAVWAVAKLNPEKAVARFVKMLKTDSSGIVRQEVVKRLGKIGGPAVAKPLFYAKSFDKDHNVRVYAEWALKNVPINDKEPVLMQLSRDVHHVVRGEAMLEIGRTGEERFFKVLSAALKKDDDEYVRACAAEGLSFLDRPEIKKELLNALGDSEGVRRKAADSLLKKAARGDDTVAMDMVKGGFGDDLYLRETGLRMLEKIFYGREAPEGVLKELYGILPGHDMKFQKQVVRCLGKIGDRGTLSFLRGYRPERTPELMVVDMVDSMERLQKKLKNRPDA
jgi:HEAT repeat protein